MTLLDKVVRFRRHVIPPPSATNRQRLIEAHAHRTRADVFRTLAGPTA